MDKKNENARENWEHILMQFQNENFNIGSFFKSTKEVLNVLQKLFKLKAGYSLQNTKMLLWGKKYIFLIKGTKFEVSVNFFKTIKTFYKELIQTHSRHSLIYVKITSKHKLQWQIFNGSELCGLY